MLDLQAIDLIINKENLPFIIDPQSKKSNTTIESNAFKNQEACGQMKH
jgi:hypothetical protein